MRLHLGSISNLGCKYIDEEYKTPNGTLLVEDIDKKKKHNVMMNNLASALSYAEFDEVKHYQTTFQRWNKLKGIYGGDDYVKRTKEKSLRGDFD